MKIYKLTDEGWKAVHSAYDGCQDGSLELEVHRLQQRDPQHRYKAMSKDEVENARRVAA